MGEHGVPRIGIGCMSTEYLEWHGVPRMGEHGSITKRGGATST